MDPGARTTLREYDGIGKVAETDWNRLAGESPSAGVGWLKTVEASCLGSVRPLYMTAETGSGRLVGASVCYRIDRGPVIGDFDHAVLGRLKPAAHRLGVSWMPIWVCCPMKCHGRHFLLDRGMPREQASTLMRRMLARLEGVARAANLAVAFPNVTDDEGLLMELLADRGYLKVNDLPVSVLDIRWADFGGYLSFLKRRGGKIGRNVRNEINRAKRMGVRFRPVDDPDAAAARLHGLLDTNCRRHSGLSFMHDRGFFASLKANMGANGVVWGAFQGSAVKGVCVQVNSRRRGEVAYVGVDRRAGVNDFTYFNLGYYTPIADAISSGMERLSFGRHLYDVKIKRGCRLIDTYTFLKPRGAFQRLLGGLWFRILGRWNRRLVPQGHGPPPPRGSKSA